MSCHLHNNVFKPSVQRLLKYEINNVMYTSRLSPFHCLLLLLFSITGKHGPVKYRSCRICNQKHRKGRYTLYLKFKESDIPNTRIQAVIYRIPDIKSPCIPYTQKPWPTLTYCHLGSVVSNRNGNNPNPTPPSPHPHPTPVLDLRMFPVTTFIEANRK